MCEVIFILNVMHVVGGVPLRVVCHVLLCDVHPVKILSAVFCVICIVLMLCLMLVVTI